jgi:hypothetical protein
VWRYLEWEESRMDETTATNETNVECESAFAERDASLAASTAPESKATAVHPRHPATFSWFRLTVGVASVMILFMMVAPCVPGLDVLVRARPVKWEYRVEIVYPDILHDRGTSTEGAIAQNQVTVADARLNALGVEGWELTGSYLEMETAFPNFGDTKYVTGLRDNVRPQRLVLIFRRLLRQ